MRVRIEVVLVVVVVVVVLAVDARAAAAAGAEMGILEFTTGLAFGYSGSREKVVRYVRWVCVFFRLNFPGLNVEDWGRGRGAGWRYIGGN
ncbi:uncharacterized protein BO66DRAFT_388325 [Aspergillus aculeatinus CBS 121060]|uniref:Uncharacterized protein n=1 Tax=Aspergillus aculeatinus CBS 121060 TaxID=1448322 RepID=A0ACD1HLE9_9EURO|nr:hypothetical protein BO66DRAFT_388325 [Aspergillus aculeatinus CBS 121060]RAH74269.1 hypothetical protein BO66DRAFT_388325 [Aspergillus aculeatinus CBS 121060]